MSVIKGVDGLSKLSDIPSALSLAFPSIEKGITAFKTSLASSTSVIGVVKAALTGLWTTISAHPLLLAAAAVTGLVIAFNKLHTSASKAADSSREALENAQSDYSDTKSNIESLNSELETTGERIDELNAKENLTLVEQEELTKLQTQNDELERTIALEEAKAKIKAKEAVAQAKETYEEWTTDKNLFGQVYDKNAYDRSKIDRIKTNTTEAASGRIENIKYNSTHFIQMGLSDSAGNEKRRLDTIDVKSEKDDINYLIGTYEALEDEMSSVAKEREKLTSANMTDDEVKQVEALKDYYDGLEGKSVEIQGYMSDYADVMQGIVTAYEDGVNAGVDVTSLEAQYKEAKSFLTEYMKMYTSASDVESEINTLLSKANFSGVKDKLVEAGKVGKESLVSAIQEVPNLSSALDEAGISAEQLTDYIMAIASPETLRIDVIKKQLKEAFSSDDYEINIHAGEKADKEWDEFIADKSDEEITIFYKYVNENGIDISGYTPADLQSTFEAATAVSSDEVEDVVSLLEEASESTNKIIDNVTAAKSILASQSTGVSVSTDDLSAEGMEDYQSALEYVNGTMQLNAEKVKEITKAKVEEQIAINDTNKALKQSEYLENAKEIENLRQKIEDNNYATGESASIIQDQIDSLLESNNAIAAECGQIDVLNASLRESIGVYQAWKAAQNGSESGDMFDDTLTAMQQIDDVLNNTESDLYGRVGREDYQTSLDLIIPNSVNKEDGDAINNYLDSIYSMFTHDDDGNRTGLNIENFCEEAVEAGLMTLDEASDSYQILGEKTMEDFAEGLGLSLPLVQAMFGEMQEFGGKFSWADEAVNTIGNLAMTANESAEALRSIEGNETLKINIDVSDVETKEEKLAVLDDTIHEMNGYKAKLSVDSEEYQQVNSIIQYCIAQKQLLNEPVIMSVDTSLVDGKIGEAITLLQQFQTAQNELEMQASIGADTTEAQANVDALVQQIQGLDPKVTAILGIDDTTTADAINAALANMSPELLVDAGVNEDAIIGYKPENKEATVKYGVDRTAVDLFDPPNLNRTVTYDYKTTGTPPSGSSGNQGVNGTAHVNGTACAGGNWGTAIGGKTLVGELGREIVVNPLTGRWYTVGDNGAEFVDIPKNAIVFNHKQSESLLQQGYVAARGTALANGTANLFGTAMVTGDIKKSQAQKSTANDKSKTNSDTKKNTTAVNNNTKAQKNNTKSQNKSTKASEKQQKAFEEFVKKWQDWIEVDLQHLEEKRDLNTAKAENATGYSKKNNYIENARKNVKSLIDDNTAAISEYKSQATKIKDNAIKNKMVTKSEANAIIKQIENGSINIKDYDEDARSFIEAYTTWYDKAKACEQAVEDLKQEQKELAQTKLDNIANEYDALIEKIEHSANMIDLFIEKAELKGQSTSKVYYEGLQKNATEERDKLVQERATLLSTLKTALKNGDFEIGDDNYNDAINKLNSIDESIQKADNNILKYANDIRQVDWDNFDLGQERISQLAEEADFLIDLMSDGKLFDDKGNITAQGDATMALHGQNYNTYMVQSDNYASEIKKINEQLAKDPSNQDLIDRKYELIKAQRESIKTAQSEKQAMIDLAKQGYDAQLSSLQKLIDKYKDALNSQKELNDYQKNVTDLADERDKLQNMVDIYSKIDTEEGRMKYQEYQTKLKEAQEELEQTEYDKYISDQENLLDDIYTQAEDFLTDKLEDTDTLIQELIDDTNTKSEDITKTLESESENVGYDISTEMKNIWGDNGSATKVLANYSGTFTEKMSAVQSTIDNILTAIKTNQNTVDQQAQSDVKNSTSDAVEQDLKKSTQTNSTTDAGKDDKSNKTEVTKDPKILKIINKGKSGKSYIAAQKKKYHGELWNYIVDGYGHVPTFAIYKELGKALGVSAPNGFNTLAEKNKLLKALKAKGFASGTGASNLKKNQWVNANEEGQEIITLSDGSILAPMKAGTGIINNPNTEKLYDLANDYNLIKAAMNPMSITNMSKYASGLSELDNQVTNSQLVNSNADTYHITNDITFNMPNVKNYNEFMNVMMRDPQFEKGIQSMTIDRINGGSKLAKNKFRW